MKCSTTAGRVTLDPHYMPPALPQQISPKESIMCPQRPNCRLIISRSCVSVVVCLSLLTQVACTSLVVMPPPVEPGRLSETTLRLTTIEGETQEFDRAWIEGDTLQWVITDGRGDDAPVLDSGYFLVSEIKSVTIRQFDRDKTVALGVLLLFPFTLLVVALIRGIEFR